jgi:Xaa-Pro aminopeptidase
MKISSDIDPTPLFYGGDELQELKLESVQRAIAAHGLDALLLIKHDAVRYVTGFYAKGYRPFLEFEYAALVPSTGLPVLGTSLAGEEARARLRSRAGDVVSLPGVRDWAVALAALLRDRGLSNGRVGFDLLPHFIHDGLRALLPSVDLVDASHIWTEVTAIKHPTEIALLREALHIAQSGMRAALDALDPGRTEIEISAIAEYEMRRQGSEMNPFIPVVASGSNAALWERVATPRVIGQNEMIILDFGCVYAGYTGDFARTTVTGDPSPAQRRLYRAAHRALQEAMEGIRPGVPCGEIDAIARRVIREEGLERYAATWAIGHQLGYGLHGSPVLGPGIETPLQAGMVVNIEPALYTPDEPSVGGVELEDTVLVTEAGSERLTAFPYDEKLLS